jgi:LDH2 family malate/lactate/ureidoglycolate dehydrogenase
LQIFDRRIEMTGAYMDKVRGMAEIAIEPGKAREFGMDVLRQLDVPPEKGEICIEAFLFGSLRGIDSHGFFALLPRLVREIRAGMIDPKADYRIVKEKRSTLLIDGCSGPGPVTALQSMKQAMRLCRENGIGGVSTYNCYHFGAASFYGFQAVREDLIGMTLGNATPRVAPYGGREGIHGTNPMSFAIPADKYPPLVVDIATSASSAGKITKALKKGEGIPEGWALDREGNPTTDPEKALQGVLLPIAGHKGYGLGLIVDILTGALAGSFCGKDVPPLEDLTTPYGASFFMLALDPGCFAGVDVFKGKVDRLIEDCITCPPMEGFERVYFPGELEAMEEAKRTKTGIPVHDSELAKFFKNLREHRLEIREDLLL